jgi:hypothetical protein
MTKPIVKYVVEIDGKIMTEWGDNGDGKYANYMDAVNDSLNTSADESAVYREVDGVLGKCLRRDRECDCW